MTTQVLVIGDIQVTHVQQFGSALSALDEPQVARTTQCRSITLGSEPVTAAEYGGLNVIICLIDDFYDGLITDWDIEVIRQMASAAGCGAAHCHDAARMVQIEAEELLVSQSHYQARSHGFYRRLLELNPQIGVIFADRATDVLPLQFILGFWPPSVR